MPKRKNIPALLTRAASILFTGLLGTCLFTTTAQAELPAKIEKIRTITMDVGDVQVGSFDGSVTSTDNSYSIKGTLRVRCAGREERTGSVHWMLP
ncbi:hypothetical protein V9056_10800, partial [Streptococcus agalactiae]|uniref:hypothetical protein n=1 Tax=Streptococcus agalactiae TaxID=1311 RepID=UPI0030103524